ncbi:MAG: AbrB/MazE/SpoVT family DNA-binding domain-containing protein [Dehalococcoidia bacterium]|nr:AbrB/MazE/SpoVT family DNA-binding domain-containing protein [Dehalococcoidia bacterium]
MTPRAAIHITRIGKRNQVTIPAAMLRKLGLESGECVGVAVEDDRLVIERAENPVKRVSGMLYRAEGPHLSDEELREAIREATAQAAAEKHARS